jgi:hypothetical protein
MSVRPRHLLLPLTRDSPAECVCVYVCVCVCVCVLYRVELGADNDDVNDHVHRPLEGAMCVRRGAEGGWGVM